tara:strand:- start:132 stop:449 length:318 start_codon:yes stop_codon:yes gene_type:complete
MKNGNMTDDEKIQLAEFIANLVVSRLNSQFDFKVTTQEVDNSETMLIDDLLSGQTTLLDDTEELLIAELARLTTLLSIYEDKEQYEKADIIRNKLRIINRKLDNL